jgi:hypothetical protein
MRLTGPESCCRMAAGRGKYNRFASETREMFPRRLTHLWVFSPRFSKQGGCCNRWKNDEKAYNESSHIRMTYTFEDKNLYVTVTSSINTFPPLHITAEMIE